MKKGRKIYWLLTAFSMFAFSGVIAQKTAQNWVFGTNNAVTFEQNPPAFFPGTNLLTLEGCSSISDGSGQLLFYTNGIVIYNRKNVPMLNGDNIAGDLSSTCNSVIVAMPDHDSLYYVFTVGAVSSLTKTFNYSVVNINADNGLGAVIEKNTEINSYAFEKLAAVRHCNKRDVWLVTKVPNSADFACYLLTPAGLNPAPVMSTTSLNVPGEDFSNVGTLKFSPDGKKLAALHTQLNKVQLMSFNDRTGALTETVTFVPNTVSQTPPVQGPYGGEFSPDGSKLYIGSSNTGIGGTALYQFDLSTLTEAAITASRSVIVTNPGNNMGGLQLGIDRQIYFAEGQDAFLSAIQNPDLTGAASNLAHNVVTLTKKSQFGFPTFIASDVMNQYAGYTFDVQKSAGCTDKSVSLLINYTADIDSVKWDFGDGQRSTQLNPTHVYPAFDAYNISLIVYRTDCSGSHTIRLGQRITLGQNPLRLPADIALCSAKDIVLRPAPGAYDSYLWSTGQTTDSIVVSQPGLYWLQTNVAGCIARDTISILQKPVTRIHLGNDTTVCAEQPVVLRVPDAGANFVWNNGSVSPSIIVTSPGDFWVTFENNLSCAVSDTVHVLAGNCDVYFPSAFTPDGDGRNETFGLINPTFTKDYELSIFNRWGELVFRSNNPSARWDGTSANKKQPVGTYAWIMKYKNKRGILQSAKGTVLLLR